MRFPEWSRKLAVAGAKILFTPAQWPHPRSMHWVSLNRARAIENQLFTVAVNGCGYAGEVKSCGHSSVFNPWGEEILITAEEEGAYLVDVDVQMVEEVRSKIPVFKDRVPELY